MKRIKLVILVVLLPLFLQACGGGSNKEKVVSEEGRLISSKLVANYSQDAVSIQGLDSRYAVNVYRVIYETKNVAGQYIDVSGIVSIPIKALQAKSPTILFHHGTMYENNEAPTENVQSSSSWVLPSYLGFITVAPDYIGYGESHGVLHPYLNANVTASTSVDLLRAAQALFKTLDVKPNNQLFLGGYSQGGGAALASQRLIESQLSDEFTVTASSAGAGAYVLSNELLLSVQAILADYESFNIVRPSNIGFIMKAMDEGYQLNVLNKLFKPEYVSIVDSIYYGSFSSTYIDNKLSYSASELLNRDFLQRIVNGEEPALVNAYKENDLIDWMPKAPTQLYHGREDDWVDFRNAQSAYDKMLANGAENIQLVECITGNNAPTDHANCFVPYIFSSYQFFLQYAEDL